MENIDPATALQFLDFTDIDEPERNWLLSSLYSTNEKIQFPWKSNTLTHKAKPQESLKGLGDFQKADQNVSAGLILNTNINVGQNGPPNQQSHQHLNYSTSHHSAPVTYQPYCTVFSQSVNDPVHLNSACTPQQKPQLQCNGDYSNLVQPVPDHYSYQGTTTPPNVLTHTVVVNSNINYNAKGYINTKLEITQGFSKPQDAEIKHEPSQTVKTNEVSESSQQTSTVKDPALAPTETPKNIQKETKIEIPTPKSSWASLFSKPATTENSGKPSNVKETEKPLAFVQPFQQNGNNVDAKNLKEPFKSNFNDPHLHRMGEYLFSHVIENQIISIQPRGLINKSNYCYINSILQALLACPPFYNLLNGLSKNITPSTDNNKVIPVIDSMVKFVQEFGPLPASLRVNRRIDKNAKKKEQTSIVCDPPVEPAYIYKMLSGIRTDTFLVEGRQEDAEEFLGCLLNGLNDEMLELIKMVDDSPADTNRDKGDANGFESDKEWQVMGPKNKGSITRRMEFTQTPISNIFGGLLRSRIHRTGDQSTDNIQPFFTLPLNIEKATTVREALEILISKNQLEGVTSSRTNQEVEAWQQVTLEELPVVLILHLKCFDYKLDGCSKIIKALEFPVDLKIDTKLLSSKTNYTVKEKQYKLFAVVYHDGKEATKGHYITDAYHIGYASWLRYDDSSVKAVQEEQVLKPHGTRVPYLLFYRRSDSVRNR